MTCHVSKLTNLLLHFLPPREGVPRFKPARFRSSQPTSPSSSPPVGESSFVTCHVLKLTNSLLPLPPLQLARPRWIHSTFLLSSSLSFFFHSSILYALNLISYFLCFFNSASS